MSDEIEDQKQVEFYSAGLAAWYATRLEHDKSLLTLSAGGIGLLMTLMTTVGVSSAESLVLYVCALVAFLVCLSTVLVIFRKNAVHLEDVMVGTASQVDPALSRLDAVGTWSFAFGVVFSVVIGISAAINSYGKVEKKMSNSDQKQSSAGIAQESFNGAARLQSRTRKFGHWDNVTALLNRRPIGQLTLGNDRPHPQTAAGPAIISPEILSKQTGPALSL